MDKDQLNEEDQTFSMCRERAHQGDSMDKDQLNEKNQEAVVIGTFKIEMCNDGSVNVSGPIGNPMVVLDVFGRALTAVADYVAREMAKSGAKSPDKPKIEERP